MNRCAFVSSASLALSLLLGACAQNQVQPSAVKHVGTEASAPPATPIPPLTQQAFSLPPPKVAPKTATHSVVVRNVKVQDLLFALARDAGINVDVHPGITGTVTINALDQTLPQLLDRISKQVDLRWELNAGTLSVMPDTPFLRSYKVDYLNLIRDTLGNVTVTTEIASTGGLSGARNGAMGGGAAGLGNNAMTRIENGSRNRFWETLVQNLKDLLHETDKLLPAAEPDRAGVVPGARASGPLEGDQARYREAASIIANAETGVISVRANARQHERVQEFLDRVMDSARRQVLIEATIAEVDLNENYQQGVDWSKLNLSGTGLQILQRPLGGITAPPSSLIEIGFTSSGGSFASSIKLLETFGTAKILSSPKVSVLNNQTAILKVVDNSVYFMVETNISRGSQNTSDLVTYTSTAYTIPIGLVMSVTPEISDNGTVLLNIRPNLSRIVGTVQDPNPALKAQNIVNAIPIVRSREIDSVIRVENGNIAVMGGLMEDAIELNKDTVPGASSLPLFGALFQNRNDKRHKTELVILLRPTIVRTPSINGDYANQRNILPDQDFFKNEAGPTLLNLDTLPTSQK